jgi:two-component system, OmpR family, response regulator ChvI
LSAAAKETKKTWLLYVDDEVDILHVVKRGLENEGFNVDVSANAEDALHQDFGKYDIIVIDIRMPRINGFQFYEAIKSRIDVAKTKICFFTAYATYEEEYQKRFPARNGSCFMIKPMSVKIFAGKLRELLAEINTN